MNSKIIDKLININWDLLLLCLPITSFSLLAKIFGNTSVAPLSAIFLGILVLIYFLPNFIQTFSIPRQSIPILIFLFISIITSALAAYLPFESFRDASFLNNTLEGLFTIVIGLLFYIIASKIIISNKMLIRSLRFIYIGGFIIIVVCLIQAGMWQILGYYPEILWKLQSFFSSRGMLFENRVTGLAFEPSWLAHQLNTLYIPLWLGFSVKQFSISKKRLFGKITIENILLVLGLLVLFLSFSRIGWLTTLLMLAFVVFGAANQAMNHWLSQRNLLSGKLPSRSQHFFAKLGMWVGLFLIFGLVILLIGVILSHIDPRMQKLFDIERYRQFGVLGWASQLSFAERLIYWITGFRVFLEHPWFGVGLGGAGFYFNRLVPEFGYALPEVVRYLFKLNIIPNIKNLWVRLLAETGIVGFAFYVSWVYLHWRESSSLEKEGKTELETAMGYSGKLFILAVIMEGFSMDTFGLPYYWIALGLIVAAKRISQSAKAPQELEPIAVSKVQALGVSQED